MRNILLAGVALLLPLPALASNPANPLTVAIPGTTTPITEGFRATAHLTVEDFGAVGDCVTDDSTAFNTYSAYLRAQTGSLPNRTFQLGFGRCYVVQSPINLAGFDQLGHTLNSAWPVYGGRLLFNGNGSLVIASNMAGEAIFDAVESIITFKDLQVVSSASGSGTASLLAFQIGRAVNATAGATPVQFDNVVVDGYFTETALLNRAAETSSFINSQFQNRYTGSTNSYTVIQDGVAKFPFVSGFYTDQLTYPTQTSFEYNTFINGTISNLGTGPALWMSSTQHHRYLGTYVHASTTVLPAVDIWFESGVGTQSGLMWEAHNENAPTYDFLVTGNATSATMQGFYYNNALEQAVTATFGHGGSVTAVTIHDFEYHVGASFTAAPMFDTASGVYTVDGQYYVPATGEFNLTSGFTGLGNVGGTITYSGGLASTVTLPSAISVSSVANAGGVSSINVNNLNDYRGPAPTCSLAAPPAGGAQATCAVATAQIYGIPSAGFGGTLTGYTNGDVVTVTLPSGCTQAMKLVLTVAGGSVTAIANNQTPGTCPATIWTSSFLATTGGTGTGLTIDNTGDTAGLEWLVPTGTSSTTITGAGAGYLTDPLVTFSSGPAGSTTATGTSSLSSVLTLSAGNGKVLLNGAGTTLGVAGVGGGPVTNVGAAIDGTGVRQTLTSTYTVPVNVSLVRFVQTGTLAASTVTLPTAFADGQVIQFVNYAGTVTALTFSPAVTGFTNASALTPNTGVRIRWDATSSTWQREQ